MYGNLNQWRATPGRCVTEYKYGPQMVGRYYGRDIIDT